MKNKREEMNDKTENIAISDQGVGIASSATETVESPMEGARQDIEEVEMITVDDKNRQADTVADEEDAVSSVSEDSNIDEASALSVDDDTQPSEETTSQESEASEGQLEEETSEGENILDGDEKVIEEMLSRKMSRRKRRKAKKRMRILNLTEDKDIHYRGFLSYRALRVIAWVFFILSQVGLLLSLGAKVDPYFAKDVGVWKDILPFCSNFMAPLFLTAAFASILNNSRKRENGTECILCLDCVHSCPNDALKL